MLHFALEQWLGKPAPGLQHGTYGKPFIGEPDTHFSVSHSGSFVAVAVTAYGPIGIDIETRANAATAADVAPLCMTPEELAYWQELNEWESVQFFASLWRLKEAVLKASGEGLNRDLRSIRLDGFPGPLRIRHLPSEYPPARNWQVGEFKAPLPFPLVAWAVVG